jgi:hypothetical protein
MAQYRNLGKKVNKRGGYGPKSISGAIGNITKSIVGKRGFIEVDIITNWVAIVGDEIAAYVSPTSISFPRNARNSGTLHVQVLSGAFAVELQHREKQIKERVNSYFGYNAVSSLKITQQPTLQAVLGKEKEKSKTKKREIPKDKKELIENVSGCSLDDAYESVSKSKPKSNENSKDYVLVSSCDEEEKSEKLNKALARLGAEITSDNSNKAGTKKN